MIITDSKRDFGTVAKVGDVTKSAESDVYSCVKFCHAKGKRDRLAVVGRDGFLKIVSLRVSVGKIHQQLIASIFVEKNLKSVAWSPGKGSLELSALLFCLYFCSKCEFYPKMVRRSYAEVER